MSRLALVSLGRIASAENIARPVNYDTDPDPCLYEMAKLWDDAYVDIDHDHDRIVGRVLDTHRLDDASGLWLAARIEIDEPPSWLRKGTGVSVAGNSLFTRERNGHVVKDILVRSIALVSPACTAAQEGARVLTLREAPDPFAPTQLDKLPPLTERTAIEHYDAKVAIGLDPDATLLDIKRKLARQKHDPRLGRRVVIRRVAPQPTWPLGARVNIESA